MTDPTHVRLPLLEGRRVLITGAGSGIGLAAAAAFIGFGAQVFLMDRDGVAVVKAAAATGAAGSFAGDVTSEGDCAAAVTSASEALGGLDGLFHAAGVGDKIATAVDLDIEEWQRIVDINLRGTFLIAREAGRHFVAQKRGAVVTVGSVLGIGGIPRRNAYGPAKAAVIMLTRNLACEWAAAGVRINCIAPGYIRTPMVETLVAAGRFDLARIEARTPAGRLGSAAEVADAAAFLLSDLARYVTGATLPVDGGWTAYGGAGDVASA
jgi:NAD(P)-dependent dehydrogenase (short-subunit alcohol dehydrogenase family)